MSISSPTLTERPAAAETAYRHTKRLVLTAALPAGTMISEGEIAEQLGLSRTPVREAFLRLESEGWLRLYPKRGALVVPVAPGEAEAVIDARLLLETHAVEALLGRPASAREEVIGQLTQVVDRQAAALDEGDLDEYARQDAQFHLTIVAAGGNDLLTTFYVTLRERQQRMVALSMVDDARRGRDFVQEHRLLVASLDAGDGAAFGEELRRHLHGAHLTGGAAR